MTEQIAQLLESDAKYRELFDAIDEGFCIIEVLFDDADRPNDYRFLEANPAFQRHTGLADAIGKRIRELAPDHEDHWYETYGRIALSGKPERFENRADAIGHWYDVYAFRVGDPRERKVGVLFHDIGERKRTEAALRANEERQAFLLKLSDTLRPLADPEEIQHVAMRVLGEHLGITRAQYFEADDTGEYLATRGGYANGAQPIVGRIRMDDFGLNIRQELCSGRTLAVADVAADSRVENQALQAYQALEIRAFIGVPLIKAGKLVVTIGLHNSAPRAWSTQDIAAAEETAERTWAAAERARVEAELRRREADLVRVQRIGRVAGINIEVAGDMRASRSPEYLRLHGLPQDTVAETHEDWLARVHPHDRERAEQSLFAALAGNSASYENEYRIYRVTDGALRWIYARADVERDTDGKAVKLVGAHVDITEQKEAQERQQVLVGELQHRVRNILAVVRSVFMRTAETERTVPEISSHFTGRLDALARTQVLVTQSASGMVDLEAMVREEMLSLGPAENPSLTIAGPEIALPPKQAEAIGLAIHELTTNAIKYGALGQRGGALEISWGVNMDHRGGRRLVLNWIEQGVPAVPVVPSNQGFGSELIREALPYRLGAETELEFVGGGVRCRIALDLPVEAKVIG